MGWVLDAAGPFLAGGATGGWWSRRRALRAAHAAGFAEATAVASAAAVATGGAVNVHLGSSPVEEFAPGTLDLAAARYVREAVTAQQTARTAIEAHEAVRALQAARDEPDADERGTVRPGRPIAFRRVRRDGAG